MAGLESQILTLIESQLPEATAGVLRTYLKDAEGLKERLQVANIAYENRENTIVDLEKECKKLTQQVSEYKSLEISLNTREKAIDERERAATITELTTQLNCQKEITEKIFSLTERVFKNPTFVKQSVGDIPMVNRNESNGYTNSYMTQTRTDLTHKETIE